MDERNSDERQAYPAWSAARQFLVNHGTAPDGSPLSASIMQVMMVGTWVGARLTALDPDFGAALSAEGNRAPGLVFESLRRGFQTEFGEVVDELVRGLRHRRGFPASDVEVDGSDLEPLGPEDAARAVSEAAAWLRQRGGEGGDEPEATQ